MARIEWVNEAATRTVHMMDKMSQLSGKPPADQESIAAVRDQIYLIMVESMPEEIEIMSLGLDADDKEPRTPMEDIEFFSRN